MKGKKRKKGKEGRKKYVEGEAGRERKGKKETRVEVVKRD